MARSSQTSLEPSGRLPSADAQQPGAVPSSKLSTTISRSWADAGFPAFGVPQAIVDVSDLVASLHQVCDSQRVNAVLIINYGWGGQAKGPTDHITADVQMILGDCYAETVFSGKGHQESDFAAATANDISAFTAASTATVNSAADQVLTEMRTQITADPSALVNLVRYGFAIGTGQRTAGLVLGAGKVGAVVTAISPFGPAAIAGLRSFDIVTKLNGESLNGLSQDQLNALIGRLEAAGGSYYAEILRADGKTVDVRYESEDIGWYLKQTTASESIRPRVISAAQNAALVQSMGGTYTGPIQDSNGGNGNLQLTLVPMHGTLSGSWGATFEKPTFNSSGTLSGATSGGTITATLKPFAEGSCILTLTGTLAKDAISGSYRSASCATQASGTFQVNQHATSLPNIAGAQQLGH